MSHELGSTRIALIGPVAPYRGGIAQHTTMLHRALAARADLLTISFTRQYPRWLYPGQSDRHASSDGHVEPHVRYLIDSLNPVTWHQAARTCVAYGCQAVVLPWSTVYWVPCFYYLARYFRRAGLDVIFLCHNVVEHETAAWKRRLTRTVLGRGSSFLVQSRYEQSQLAAFLPGARVAVHAHPIVEGSPAAQHVLSRRAALELLFYGFVRPYKGLDILVEAMDMLKGEDVHLTIAGEFWSGRAEIEARISQLGLWNQIDLVPRFVSGPETAEYFDRADLVVLPYRSATVSGVVPLAYGYRKPVIVTRTAGLPEVVVEGQTGYTVAPESPGELADAIRKFQQTPCESFEQGIATLRPTMTWSSLAGVLLDLAGPRPR